MDNLRQLLVAIAALTLLFSVVSGANPNYFVEYSAFADDEEDGEEDDNSGSSSNEEEDNDDSNDRHESSDDSEHTVEAAFGQSSKVKLEIDDEVEDEGANAGLVEAELEVETEDGDVPNGEHDVSLSCDTPELDKLFDSPLVVENGAGEFQGELGLVNGTSYEDCHVTIGDMEVDIPAFRVLAGTDDEEEDDDSRETGRGHDDDEEDDLEDDDDDNKGRGDEHRARLEAEDNGVELQVETDVNMTDGTYDVQFVCEDPDINLTIEDALQVQDGEGKFKAEINLADGTYNDCKVMVGDDEIASFDSFTVAAGSEEEIEEKRKEKRRDIVSRITSQEEHKRRLNASPASTGDYDPGWNYTLTANGTGIAYAEEEDLAESSSNTTGTSNSTELEVLEDADVDIALDMAVWKSNKALVLLSVLNGTVEANGETYNVELGYALYSTSHNVMRLGAFVSDEDGNIYKLKLRGAAVGEDAEFPMASGDSIEMTFEGNSGPARNSFDHWYLELDGTVAAD